jgi:hypothetical protein
MRATTLKAIIAVVGVFATERVHPQGAFGNLDFEQAIAPLVPDAGGRVPIASALPGWTGYVGGSQVSVVRYDGRNIDAAGISVFDRLPPQFLQPLQGNYSAWLERSSVFAGQQSAAIAQVGEIPAGMKSIVFLSSSTDIRYLPQVTFAGHTIPLVELGANTLGGDVSSFAGDTGELRFTAPPDTADLLDSIEFSPVAIPEPTAMVLSLLGVLVVGWRVRGSVL